MKITKLGHCCLLIEEQGVRILTDPGMFTIESHSQVKNINVVLITHEHGDHFHIPSLKEIIKNNPDAKIVTNAAVGKLLDEEKITYQLVEHGQGMEYQGVSIEGYGEVHADIYKTITPVENTGYFINNYLFYPGDAFTNPGKQVTVLALPVAGPWMKISEAIDYATELHPQFCFPVHDGMIKPTHFFHMVPQKALELAGISFVSMVEGDEKDF